MDEQAKTALEPPIPRVAKTRSKPGNGRHLRCVLAGGGDRAREEDAAQADAATKLVVVCKKSLRCILDSLCVRQASHRRWNAANAANVPLWSSPW